MKIVVNFNYPIVYDLDKLDIILSTYHKGGTC